MTLAQATRSASALLRLGCRCTIVNTTPEDACAYRLRVADGHDNFWFAPCLLRSASEAEALIDELCA